VAHEGGQNGEMGTQLAEDEEELSQQPESIPHGAGDAAASVAPSGGLSGRAEQPPEMPPAQHEGAPPEAVVTAAEGEDLGQLGTLLRDLRAEVAALQLGGHGYKPTERAARREERRRGVRAQRERIGTYEAIGAVCRELASGEPGGADLAPTRSARAPRVTWSASVDDFARVARRSRRSSVQVAPASASAWESAHLLACPQQLERSGAAPAPSGKGERAESAEPPRQNVETGDKAAVAAAPPEQPRAPSPDSVMATWGRGSGLHVGSADPHELHLNDDRVARSRRAPTFDVTRHVEAESSELRARAVARLNAPEAVEPRPEPEPQPQGAPTVTSLEQLLKPEWLRRVRVWTRRCRRCIRLARAGKWRAARNMRPPDLWVSAEDSMLPDVAAWVWDLRPLARGEPAVPVQTSGVAGVKPPGDINLARVAEELSMGSFADKGILTEVLAGIADDVTAPRGSLLCAPHTGALKGMRVADEKLAALVSEGWAEAHAALPYWPIRCDPYSIVDESERVGAPLGSFVKARMTNDHSWGAWGADGSSVPSLNDAMDRSGWPRARMVRVREVAEAAAIMQTSGVPVKASVMDCRAYYKRFGRQLAEVWRNAAATGDGFVVDERCCFGSAADAAKCTRFSNVLVHAFRRALRAVDEQHPPRDPRVLAWLAERRAAGEAAGASEEEIAEQFATLHVASMYIDDESTLSIDDVIVDAAGTPLTRDGRAVTRAQLHFEAVRDVLKEFGHESEPRKEQPPCDVPELLGAEIDLVQRRLRLAQRKRESYARAARTMARAQTCEADDFVSLLGKLTFAATCYPHGRVWLNAPWRAARAKFRTRSGAVVISRGVRADLLRWAVELEKPDHVGVPLAARAAMPAADSADACVIYADAARDCARAGFGAWSVVGDELVYTRGEWSAQESELLICDLELAASTLGLVALQPVAARASVYSFTDNTVALAAMRRRTPRTEAMQRLASARGEWLHERGVLEAAERITSAANRWADALSRGDEALVLEEARALGLTPRRVDPPASWRALVAELRPEPRDEPAPSAASVPTADARASAPTTPGRSRGGGAAGRPADDVGSARPPAPPLHASEHGGRRRGREGDRRPLVAQVRGHRAGRAAVHVAEPGVAARGEGGGGAAADGLRHLAGAGAAVGPADRGAHDPEVHLAGALVAPARVQDGPDRRARHEAAGRPAEGRDAAGRAAGAQAPVGDPDAGSGRGSPAPPVGADGSGGQLGRRADDCLLRPAARRRVRRAVGRALRPCAAPDARRREAGARRAGARVPALADARREERVAGEGDADRAGRRRLAAGPGGRVQAAAGARPGAQGAGRADAALPGRRRRGALGARRARHGQAPHALARPRRAALRSSLTADWRCDGGPRGQPVPGGAPRRRPLVE